jgi:hypothetical protein
MDLALDDVQRLTGKLNDLAVPLTSNGTPDPGIRFEMVSTAKQLLSSLISPEEHALQEVVNSMELIALRTTMKLGVLEALPDQGAITIEELSKRSGAQEALLESLVKMLVAVRFLAQDSHGLYGHTRFSRAYRSVPGDAGSVPGDAFSGLLYDGIIASLVHFPEYLDTHAWEEPSSIEVNPFTWHHGKEGANAWAVLESIPGLLP